MATTTLMKDSIVGDDWIRQMMQTVPPQKVTGPDGLWTGDILSGPVRLSWAHLFKLAEKSAMNQNPKFEATLLFPAGTDMSLFYEEYYRIAGEKFQSFWNGQQYVGLHSPFHDQGEKFKYDGYMNGSIYFKASSNFKPPVVTPVPGDPNRFNPVVDEAKVYPGVWAIVAMNCFASGLNQGPQAKKGPAFGLQSVVIIGEDQNLGGGKAADPTQMFGGLGGPAGLPAPIQRPNFAGIPGAQPSVPPTPGYQPMTPVMPGVPVQQPGMPATITTTYRPAPPPPSQDDDDYSWNK